MRLPTPEELTSDDERFLYSHDVLEYHASDPHSFIRLGYLRRLWVMLEMVERLGKGLRVLDVGCAQGNLALLLAEAGHDVTAGDLRPDFLRYARRKYERGKLTLVELSAEELPYRECFDLVVLGELLEHAARPGKLLESAAGAVRPSGRVLVTTPNGEFFLNRLPTWRQAKPADELAARQFQPDGDGHLFLLTGDELLELVTGAGLTPETIRYFNSPFATGAAKFRHVGRFLPRPLLGALERTTSRLPGVRRRACAAMALMARRPE